MSIVIHKAEDFIPMRKACALAAEILDKLAYLVKPGVTTLELNEIAHQYMIEAGATPAPLTKGFPKAICTSVNHVVCHGVPSDKKLKSGDILNIDVSLELNGWFGDTGRMYFVGTPGIKQKRLSDVTYEAMMLGIEQVKPGAYFGDIGNAIFKHATKHGYSVVREYGGHGIGRELHGEPHVSHYGKAGTGPVIKEGMFFTIEPMINAGRSDTLLSKFDGWTVTTRDKSLSAQFEHCIGVTKTGYEIFTLSKKNLNKPPYEC